MYPGAEEIFYDSIDQDCTGADVDDADGDGWAATEAGGPDCDDADPGVNPGAEPETWARGFTDVDCSGDLASDTTVFGTTGTFLGGTAGADAGHHVAAAGDLDGEAGVNAGAVTLLPMPE